MLDIYETIANHFSSRRGIIMSEWKHIDQEQPTQGQPVYYWFGAWDKIYSGFFEVSEDEECKGMFFFYGKSGFLGDDITWWMPREELPDGVEFLPEGPTDEQKANCKYHPVKPALLPVQEQSA
jgi:hypothetical protein